MKNKEKYMDEICKAITSKYPTLMVCRFTSHRVFNVDKCWELPNCKVCKERLEKWLEEEYKENEK